MASVKKEALVMVRKLPTQATWDDLMYEIYARKKIEQGIEAADQKEVISHEEVKRRFCD